jgi:hypothetical protein
VNFTFDTIAPVRELVIVIADLYLPRERGSPSGDGFHDIPGIECVARFGARAPLPRGWRNWLLATIGRTDLEEVAPACIAAAALETGGDAAATAEHRLAAGTRWIATAVHVRAGLTHAHLDPRGLLRLAPAEQGALAADFAGHFGSAHHTLIPLPSGEFLLGTLGLTPCATEEPARHAGGVLEQLMPSGPAAAPLRRLLAEIEMWLHAQPLNEARSARGEAPVTALWPWGATGRIVQPEQRALCGHLVAFGRDAWLEGLWRLQGEVCRPVPQHLEEVLAAGASVAVLTLELRGQLRDERDTVSAALSRLDERFIAPALQRLRRGALTGVTVVLNDTRVRVGRGSLRRFWHRPVPGLAGFA